MKRIFTLLMFMCFFLVTKAQIKYDFKVEKRKAPDVVCPARFVDSPSFRDMPAYVKDRINNPKARIAANPQGATFDVTYVGFPEEAKAAFQRAVDIWANMLRSTVNIKVTAYWESLDNGVLGSANTTNYYRNFSGAREVNTYYPIALAEKLAGKEVNSINEDDIFCRFNSDMPWYFGTSSSVPSNTFDFTSIVLHELGHGLGFVSSMRVSGTQGSYGFGGSFYSIFDKFIIKQTDSKYLVDTLNYKNPSATLKTALTSKDLNFVGPNTAYEPVDSRIKLYAPSTWESGSSISHLDDVKYGKGGPNSLMTPTASYREKNLDPGPHTMAIFAEMGWKSTSISHEPLKNILAARKVRFEAKILSDTSLVSNSAKISYILNDAAASTAVVLPLQKGSNGLYFADIDLPANSKKIEYYFSVIDNFKDTVTAPASGGFGNQNYIYSFEIGQKDQFGPVIEHYQPEILISDSPVSLVANVEDDYQEGIDTVYVEYSVNGISQSPIGLKKYRPGIDNPDFSQGSADIFAYFQENGIKNLKDGDLVKYRIIAQDKSKNKTILPTYYGGENVEDTPQATFYEFLITDLKGNPVKEYSTDFETDNGDFAKLGFSITQPSGFTSNGLHSSHPYKNGIGLLDPATDFPYMSFERNEIAMLKVPIELKSTGATVTFDEVVLVEPGEAGSVYGENGFFDFVVVEGSLDGVFWFPLEDGYDSRKYATMEKLYNSKKNSGTQSNSTATGTLTYQKSRTIEIYGDELTSDFAGETMLLRFRLYADQWTNGWGWSIDNLYVQKAAPKVLSNDPNQILGLKMGPNPSQSHFKVEYQAETENQVKIEIFDMKGRTYYTDEIPTDAKNLNHDINISNLKPGTYLLKLTENERKIIKRFVKL
ncbi:MAG: T9SS type A sorting domain-containing protein [Cytophagaceae bacterium]|nr:T9SS type A sorting domain-containing protein [Cytophagaceae bacterium]MBL0326674.1 T9SS type A sorting domain-containing protein [Cytophagaceae bacterium]